MKIPSTSERSKFQARMKLAPSPLPSGARVLPDLLDRCTVDDETGCWIWKLGMSDRSSSVRCPVPVLWSPIERRITQAGRHAWLLAGFDLAPGEIVFRYRCANGLCIHPLHAAAGTRSDMNDYRSSSGRLKADAVKLAKLDRARAAMMVPPSKVAQIEAALDSGVSLTSTAREFGICFDTAKSVARGKHPYSRGRQRLVPGASVFAIGGGAR